MYKLRRDIGAPPMYAQIADGIASDVANGRYRIGEFLPSEIVMSKQLGVSRATITKAYSVLEDRRLVSRIQGSGTQVAPVPMEREIIDFTGFTQHVLEQGRQPGSKLLAFEAAIGGGDDPVCSAYSRGLPLVVIERLRTVDGKSRGVQRVALPAELAESAGISRAALTRPDASLYALLTQAGITLATAEETLTASIATDEECKLMRIPKYSPIIEVFRKSFDQSGRMLEAVRARYLGSAYVYKVRLGPTNGV